MEDLIASADVVVTLSHSGYIKSQLLEDYRAQKRSGRGKQATGTKEDDFIDNLFFANTHDYILCFSSRGRVYWIGLLGAPGRPCLAWQAHRQSGAVGENWPHSFEQWSEFFKWNPCWFSRCQFNRRQHHGISLIRCFPVQARMGPGLVVPVHVLHD